MIRHFIPFTCSQWWNIQEAVDTCHMHVCVQCKPKLVDDEMNGDWTCATGRCLYVESCSLVAWGNNRDMLN